MLVLWGMVQITKITVWSSKTNVMSPPKLTHGLTEERQQRRAFRYMDLPTLTLRLYRSGPSLLNHHRILTLIRGRASLPVGRAAFKAVELLLKWLVGSTPTSSAVFIK